MTGKDNFKTRTKLSALHELYNVWSGITEINY